MYCCYVVLRTCQGERMCTTFWLVSPKHAKTFFWILHFTLAGVFSHPFGSTVNDTSAITDILFIGVISGTAGTSHGSVSPKTQMPSACYPQSASPTAQQPNLLNGSSVQVGPAYSPRKCMPPIPPPFCSSNRHPARPSSAGTINVSLTQLSSSY